MKIVEANLRQIEKEARRLSEGWDVDITPSDAYGILISAQRALAALTGSPLVLTQPSTGDIENSDEETSYRP